MLLRLIPDHAYETGLNPLLGRGDTYRNSVYQEIDESRLQASLLPEGSHGQSRVVLDILNRYRDALKNEYEPRSNQFTLGDSTLPEMTSRHFGKNPIIISQCDH